MAAIKVIRLPISACTQRVLLVLMIEKGAEYVIPPVDMTKGAHKEPGHLATQPFGQILVIEDGNFKLFEKYQGQGPLLYGKTLQEKALVKQWLAVEIEEFNAPITVAVVQLVLGPKYRGIPIDEAIVSSSLEKLENFLDVYEAQLAKSKFLAG